MHWTLQTLCFLTAFTVMGGAFQWLVVRSVPLGTWVVAGWMAQQSYWLATGEDSAALFAICDLVIFIMAWRMRGMWRVRWIIGLTMLSVAGHVIGGVFGWWWSYYCVAASMLLGLPWMERAGWRWPERRLEHEGA